jgi:glycosyltransferase involved in cell wall biosynthesis
MDIVCWLRYPSHYYTGIFRALSEQWHGKVVVVFEKSQNNLYKGLDLQLPDLGKIIPHYLDKTENPQSIANNIVHFYPDAIHIVGGFTWRVPIFRYAFSPLLQIPNAKIVLMAEIPNLLTPIKYFVKNITYCWNSMRFRSRISAMLAMGELGVETYYRFGIEQKKLFPFMYCVDTHFSKENDNVTEDESGKIRFINIMGLKDFYRKGLDLIFKAFSLLRNDNWSCDLLGFEPTPSIKQETKKLDIIDKIRFLGTCKNTEVFDYLMKNDVILFPSRLEGYGVALMEGIYCGLAGITTDRVPSKDLVEAFRCGSIVKPDNVTDLINALRFCIENRNILKQWKQNALKNRHLLTAEAVGNYLKEILEFVFVLNYCGEHPIPPWKRDV